MNAFSGKAFTKWSFEHRYFLSLLRYYLFDNIPVVKSPFNSTGGSREVNGKGTMILVETHELDVNEEKTKEDKYPMHP